MDPSEFEGTVAKSNDVLSAGALEEIFSTSKPKFAHLDLSKEAGDLHLQIFHVQECINKWNDFSLDSLKDELESKVVKVTEQKEDYVSRKKALAAKVRLFSKKYLSELDEDIADEDRIEATKILIQDFKTEFDFLSETTKFSELCFIATFKIFQEMVDPRSIIQNCLDACLRSHEALKSAIEQLSVASSTLSELSSQPAPAASASSEDLARLAERLEAEKAQNEKLNGDVMEMKTRFEIDLRNREQSLRTLFEQRQLDMQQQLEYTLSAKEEEVSSLLSSLNDLRQRSSEAEQKERLLEVETNRRRDIEDKLRQTQADLAESQYALQLEKSHAESSRGRLQLLEAQMEREYRVQQETEASLKEDIAGLKQVLQRLELVLDSRPPVDLSAFASRIGVQLPQECSHGQEGSAPWSAVESFIIDNFRKANSEASDSRVREQEVTKSFAILQDEVVELRQKVQIQCESIIALEGDLMTAHSSLEATQGLVKAFQGKGFEVPPYVSSAGLGDAPVSSVNSQYKTGRHAKQAAISLDKAPLAEEDLERGGGGKGTASLLLGTQDRMMQAVQGQRDRFMKAAAEKDQELQALKARLDHLQEEQLQLKSENLELYRRLRVLRVSANSSAAASSSSSVRRGEAAAVEEEEGGHTRRPKASTRSRKDKDEFDFQEESSADAIDNKYYRLYEEKIDPFRIEELDRQSLISRLNIFERGLAYLTRFFLQDQWARHVLMIYMFLIHCFALAYVVNVLNPQLIDEVDVHMKTKWSKATLDMNMDREHPDVRW